MHLGYCHSQMHHQQLRNEFQKLLENVTRNVDMNKIENHVITAHSELVIDKIKMVTKGNKLNDQQKTFGSTYSKRPKFVLCFVRLGRGAADQATSSSAAFARRSAAMRAGVSAAA